MCFIGPLYEQRSAHRTDLVQRRDQLGAACGLDPPETLWKEKRGSHRTVDGLDSALLWRHGCLLWVTAFSLPRKSVRRKVPGVVYCLEIGWNWLQYLVYLQGGSNMTGTDLCVNKPHMSVPVIFEPPCITELTFTVQLTSCPSEVTCSTSPYHCTAHSLSWRNPRQFDVNSLHLGLKHLETVLSFECLADDLNNFLRFLLCSIM
jgi:hypothetical protein